MVQNNKTLYTLIIFSENLAGVLNQVTAVFTRRQINIESLNVSASRIEGIHRYTITCWCDEEQIKIVTKQIEKKIDVIQANYFTADEIFIMEVGLFKLSTPRMAEHREVSKAIRFHNAKILEVNKVYAIVSIEGMTEDIVSLYYALKEYDCVLQYVRSGAVAITKSKSEVLNEYLEERRIEQERIENLLQ